MEILKAYHNTESLGYGFSSIKNKLKPELIIEARKKEKK